MVNKQMEGKSRTNPEAGTAKTILVKVLLIALICEKIIQHVLVSLALYFNWGDIGSSVAVRPAILMVLGAITAVLFMLCLWAIVAHRKGGNNLVVGLAVWDIVGEYIAQGRMDIAITVSFVVAILLLILAALSRRS